MKNSLQVFRTQIQHLDWLISVNSTRMWWFVIWRNLKATLLHFRGTYPSIFFETQSIRIIAVAVQSFSLFSSGSPISESSSKMGVQTSLQIWYPLLNEEYLNVVEVVSVSVVIGVAKGVCLDLRIYFIYNDYSYCMKKSLHLNFCCLFFGQKIQNSI